MKEINMNKELTNYYKELTNEQLAIVANRILENEDEADYKYSWVVECSKNEKFMERYNILKEKIADPKISELERFYAKKAFEDEYEHFDWLYKSLEERNNMVGWLNGECELSEYNVLMLTGRYYSKDSDWKPSFIDNIPAWIYAPVILATFAGVLWAFVASI